MKDLSLHILDILQNSIEARATLLKINIEENTKENVYTLTIEDNGKGMSKELLKKVVDPFFTSRTTRKVGLGIPLLKQKAELTGGSFYIDSEEGKGTLLIASFLYNNIDRPALGDVAGVLVLTAASNENIRFVYQHNTKEGEYIFDTNEINEALDGMSLNNAKVIHYLKDMIIENLVDIQYTK